DIRMFEDYIFTLEEKLPDIHDLVSSGLEDTKNAQNLIDEAQAAIPKAEQTTKSGLETVRETSGLLSKAEDRLNELAPQIEEDLQKAQNTAEDINRLLQDAQRQDIDFSEGKELQQNISNSLDDATSRISEIEAALQQLKEMNQDRQDGEPSGGDEESSGNRENPQQNINGQDQVIADAVERLETLRGELEEARKNGDQITSFIDDKKREVDSILSDLEELSGNTATRIGDFLTEYKENIEPEVEKKINHAQQTLADAEDILTGIQSTIPEVKQVLASTEEDIGQGRDYLNTILGEYPYVHDKVNNLADRIRDVQSEADINEII